jgi:hypothetical protein
MVRVTGSKVACVILGLSVGGGIGYVVGQNRGAARVMEEWRQAVVRDTLASRSSDHIAYRMPGSGCALC